MKITKLSAQAKNPDRVNVSVDGKYGFSLDISQIVDLGIKEGQEISDQQMADYLQESEFGKLYDRTLEYCLFRPHSSREVKDYLQKKTFAKPYKNFKGETKQRLGVSQSIVDRVFDRLVERGYVDDEKFAQYWLENRHQRKGASLRKLRSELSVKGVASDIIDRALGESERNDSNELMKIIDKKRSRYPDEQKLIAYLARQGFSYDDIKSALAEFTDN